LIQQLNNSSLVNQGQNILHLDLLPENLYMSKIVQIAKLQQCQPKILDFHLRGMAINQGKYANLVVNIAEVL